MLSLLWRVTLTKVGPRTSRSSMITSSFSVPSSKLSVSPTLRTSSPAALAPTLSASSRISGSRSRELPGAFISPRTGCPTPSCSSTAVSNMRSIEGLSTTGRVPTSPAKSSTAIVGSSPTSSLGSGSSSEPC